MINAKLKKKVVTMDGINSYPLLSALVVGTEIGICWAVNCQLALSQKK
jgi:hypothetical protein